MTSTLRSPRERREREKVEGSPPWGGQSGSWPEQLQNLSSLEFRFSFHTKISQIQMKTTTKGGKLRNQRDLLTAVFELPAEPERGASLCLSYLGSVSHSFWGPRAFCTSGLCEGLRTPCSTVSRRLYFLIYSTGLPEGPTTSLPRNMKTAKGTLPVVHTPGTSLAASGHCIPLIMNIHNC